MRRTSVSSPASATKTWTGAALERRGFGVDRLAWWLDNAITVPGTRWRIGYDALIGLIPGVGDFVGTLLSSYIIVVAAAQGLPPSALARMVINVGLEALVGAVPIVGDLFDAAWKANQRNIGLMAQFQGTPEVARRQSRAVVAAWAAAAITLIVILGIGAFAIVRWLVDVLRSAG